MLYNIMDETSDVSQMILSTIANRLIKLANCCSALPWLYRYTSTTLQYMHHGKHS